MRSLLLSAALGVLLVAGKSPSASDQDDDGYASPDSWLAWQSLLQSQSLDLVRTGLADRAAGNSPSTPNQDDDGYFSLDSWLAWQSFMQMQSLYLSHAVEHGPSHSPKQESHVEAVISDSGEVSPRPPLHVGLAAGNATEGRQRDQRLPLHVGLAAGNATEGQQRDHRLPLQVGPATSIATEGWHSLAEEMPALIMGAASRVAGQSFDPFDPFAGAVQALHPGQTHLDLTHKGDVWPALSEAKPKNGDEGLNFFKSAPRKDWMILVVTCVVLFVFDLTVIQRFQQSFRMHALTLVFWLCVAVLFNAVVWVRFGHAQAFDWCTGYYLEWILSLDNLFVFHLVFETYKTPPNQTHRAVFLGILGAVIIRMVFFMVVSTLLHYFSWIRIPFGLLLIWSGVQAARGDDDDMELNDMWLVRSLKWFFGSRLKDGYDEVEGRLFVREKGGTWQVTLLAMVVVLLELSDVIFALDSVSAKIAQIPQQYIAFSSTVLAMFGLRAMFFIIKDLVEMFELLQYGLCLILVFIGIELMFAHYIKLPSGTVCIMILSVFIIFTAASVARRRIMEGRSPQAETAHEDEGPGTLGPNGES